MVSETVIVRGFADEPVLLTAVGQCDDGIELVGADESMPVTLGGDWVYAHSQPLYSNLRRAYDDGRADDLETMWKSALHFDGSALPELEIAE
ncbi:MAG: hypothetical protein SH850_10610 [Planctomycetaceae bacterium]|nr:hypothetical protein [Planctomycetaceae bacterium]